MESAAADSRGGLSAQQLQVVVANTVAVLTFAEQKRQEWRQAIVGARQQAQAGQDEETADLLQAILALLDGAQPDLPEGNRHHPQWQEILDGIREGGTGTDAAAAPEIMQAIEAYVGAPDWAATQAVVEERWQLLSQPQVEAIFAQNIAQAQQSGQAQAARFFQQHLDLLRACQAQGIAVAFAQLQSAAGGDGDPDSDEAENQPESVRLPFPQELIPRTVAALQGGPQERMELVAYVGSQDAAGDSHLAAFYAAVKLAAFGGDVQEVGRGLTGLFAQAWQAIVVGLAQATVDTELLQQILGNTLAVLGPAAAQRGEWQENLAQLRNHAAAGGDDGLLRFVDAVGALLTADGDATGLGAQLPPVYDQAWAALVEALHR